MFDGNITGSDAIIWDNSNIVESYAGVTTPLTFSHVNHAYREVYIQTCGLLGVPQSVIEEHEGMFRNMLGLIRGRIYYKPIELVPTSFTLSPAWKEWIVHGNHDGGEAIA